MLYGTKNIVHYLFFTLIECLIRRAFIGKKYVYIAAGKKSDLQAKNELMQQAGADLNRRYLMKKQVNGLT